MIRLLALAVLAPALLLSTAPAQAHAAAGSPAIRMQAIGVDGLNRAAAAGWICSYVGVVVVDGHRRLEFTCRPS